MSIFFKCGLTHDFDEVNQKVSAIAGVKLVAKLPGTKGGTEEGMIEVESQEAGEAAVQAMQAVGAEFVAQPSNSTGDDAPKRGAKKEKNDGKTKEFFDNFATLQQTRSRQRKEEQEKHSKVQRESERDERRGREQRNGSSSNGRKGDDRDGKSRSRSGGAARRGGGRGGGGRGFSDNHHSDDYYTNSRSNNRSSSRNGRGGGNGRGRGGNNGRRSGGYNMPQFIQGHLASINNVPMSMTNDQIATVFDECGTIYDIARYETLAMIFFDSPDSVLNAIVLVNGTKKMNGSLSTVSDGGPLRVPIPHNLDREALSPHAIHMHQQGMMAPLQNPMMQHYSQVPPPPPSGAPPAVETK